MKLKELVSHLPFIPEMMDDTDADMEVVIEIGHSKLEIEAIRFDYDNMRIVIETK